MVGYLAAHVALRHFIVYMDQLNIGEEIDKFIIAPDQRQIMIQKTTGRTSLHAKAASRAYRAAVPSMNWQIALRIPEKVLFEDVHHLLSRSISFILLVVAFAIAASLVFSRRITRPLAQVIQGTKEFAANNLEYRIDLKSGYEGKQLADAFNTMADQLQKRQQELIRYNKLAALGLLSAGIAHEVKNPLAGIKTSSQVVTGLLADSVKTSEKAGAKTRDAHNIVTIKASEYSDIINILIDVISEVDRLDKIATDLLDFGRPWDSNRIQCDLSDITKRTLHLLRKELGQKRVKVVNNVTNAAAYVDPDQIMQVFVNLILNAIEAVEPDTGVIRITSKSRNTGETQFQVADNGHGIPEAKINRLFDPFFTLTSHGTGLGLSVVYTLLKQNSVHMDVHSRLNEGTVFTLTFSPNCPM
jgi:signal transduction histidine kinase